MLDDNTLIQLLMERRLLTPDSLKQGRLLQKQNDAPLYFVLLENELIDEAEALAVLSAHVNTPCVSLRSFKGDPNLLERVPKAVSEAYQVLPIGLMSDGDIPRLFLAMTDPADLIAMDAISQATGLDVEPVLVGPTDLKDAINRCYKVGTGAREFVLGEFADQIGLAPTEPGVELEESSPPSGHPPPPNIGERTNSTAGFSESGIAGMSWGEVELDEASDDYLNDLISGFASGDQGAKSGARPTGIRPIEIGDDDLDDLDDSDLFIPGGVEQGGAADQSDLLAGRDKTKPPVDANVFQDFMTKSSIHIISPPERSVPEPMPSPDYGSADVLQSVVRLLVHRGVFTEADLMKELAEVRKGTTRGPK